MTTTTIELETITVLVRALLPRSLPAHPRDPIVAIRGTTADTVTQLPTTAAHEAPPQSREPIPSTPIHIR